MDGKRLFISRQLLPRSFVTTPRYLLSALCWEVAVGSLGLGLPTFFIVRDKGSFMASNHIQGPFGLGTMLFNIGLCSFDL